MSYEVLARKWRPQQFEDVVGQDHVTRTLKNAISAGRVAHAYLFVGPRGIGKTSIARILAKALNCAKGISEKPCDKCTSCKEIVTGTNFDVLEIDGASNRGIDEIRALREAVKYMPTGRHKIYIIDEVHMLTTEAFNALLKTLEEPPPHVKFFLATTDPQKVPLTILSRCQRFDLRRIHLKLLMERLSKIAKSEKVKIDDDALLAVSRAAEGSMRDAESALDQLISFQNKDIHESDVIDIFGLVPRQALEALAQALLEGDIVKVVQLVEDCDKQGKDMQKLMLELIEHFRNILLFLQAGEGVADLNLTESQTAVLKTQAVLTNSDRLLRVTDLLLSAADRLRYALSKKTLLETTLIRCARVARGVALDEILAQLKELKNSLGLAPQAAPAGSADPAEKKGETRPAAAYAPRAAAPQSVREKPVPPEKDECSLLRKEWHSIVAHVGRIAVLAKGNLLNAMPVQVADDQVIIGFDPEFADKLEQAKMPRNLHALQMALNEVLRRKVSIVFKIVKVPGPGAEAKPAGEPAQPGTDDKNAPKGSVKGAVGGKNKWISNEAVQKTMDMFKGTITDIKE